MKIDSKYIESKLKTSFIGKSVLWFDSINTTQEIGKNLIKKEGTNGQVIGSETMSNGYGQFNRPWFTKKYKGLYFSIILKPIYLNNFQHLKILVAISLATAIKNVTGIKCKVKFPNDIYYNQKKIAGVLSEFINYEGIYGVVLGIGINVNTKKEDFPEEIVDKATSLSIITDTEISREDLLIAILEQIEIDYFNYIHYGFDYINKLFSEYSSNVLVGKLKNGQLIEGVYAGLTKEGYLKLKSKETNKIYVFKHGSLVALND